MEEGRKQTEALIAAFMGQNGQRELEQPSQKAPLVVIPTYDRIVGRLLGTVPNICRSQLCSYGQTSAGFSYQSVARELQASE